MSCTACGTDGHHTGEECVARRPMCHACAVRPTCIQAMANNCYPTCLDCYFDRRIIRRRWVREGRRVAVFTRHDLVGRDTTRFERFDTIVAVADGLIYLRQGDERFDTRGERFIKVAADRRMILQFLQPLPEGV